MDNLFEKYGKEYKKGEYLFYDGDYGDEMYILLTGSVDIVKGSNENERVIATLYKGNFFGEMSILNNRSRSASVRISSDSAKMLVLNKPRFHSMILGDSAIAIRMLEELSDRLFNANKTIENLLFKISILEDNVDNNKKNTHKEPKPLVLSNKSIEDSITLSEENINKIFGKEKE